MVLFPGESCSFLKAPYADLGQNTPDSLRIGSFTPSSDTKSSVQLTGSVKGLWYLRKEIIVRLLSRKSKVMKMVCFC